MRNKNPYRASNIGIVTLIMIFVIMCLIIFATLTFSESTDDLKYSKAMAEHNQAYFEASNLAQEKLADISSALKSGESLPAEVSFDITIDERHALHVAVNTSNKNDIKITSYKEITTTDWDGDTSMHLINTNE